MRKPVLRVRNVTKIFGKGCRTCLDDCAKYLA
jgi:hypothetical protein